MGEGQTGPEKKNSTTSNDGGRKRKRKLPWKGKETQEAK